LSRREFIGAALGILGAALLGAVGGATAQEDGRWHVGESDDDDEPPH